MIRFCHFGCGRLRAHSLSGSLSRSLAICLGTDGRNRYSCERDRRVVQTNCTWIHTEEWERGGRLRLRRISGWWSGEGKKEGRAATMLRLLYMRRRAYYLLDVDRGSRI